MMDTKNMLDDLKDSLINTSELYAIRDALFKAESSGFTILTPNEIKLAVQEHLRNNGQL